MNATARPRDLWWTEQIEAVAIAIAMALVLKFFVIEAYQIPTGSMQPTILGDGPSGIKDRVLADKICTMLRPPRRWEVMIFRFPHDERRLYVKRMVGLPGETLEIHGGDVWIDGQIARKPDSVNDSVLKTVFPSDDGGVDIGRAFTATAGVQVNGRTATFPSSGQGTLRLRQPVRDQYLHGYDPDWGIRPSLMTQPLVAVADLDVEFDATLEPAAKSLTVLFSSDQRDVVFTVPREGTSTTASITVRLPDGTISRVLAQTAGLAIPAGEPVEIAARDVDHRLVLWVDGDEWFRFDDDELGPRPDRPSRAQITLAVQGSGSIRNVVLRRDIFYLRGISNPHWEIPPDSYFALGDNTQASHDSRTWELKTYVLRDREVTGFWFQRPGAPDANPRVTADGHRVFADVHGDETVFAPSDILEERMERAPFIHQRYLLGKATAVFWPIFRPFRWKFIQ